MVFSDEAPAGATSAQPAEVRVEHDATKVQPPRSAAAWLDRHPHVRHYLHSLDHLGVLFGLIAFVISLSPSLLPRAWPMQGVISGITVATGYGLGVIVAWVGRRAGVRPLSRTARRRLWLGLAAVSIVLVPVILWLSSAWQNDVRRAVGMPPSGRYLYLGMFVLTVAVTAGLIGSARLVRDIYRLVTGRLARYVPAPAARLVAVALVVALVISFYVGVLARGFLNVADRMASSANHGTDAGVVAPVSSLRSGSQASLVSWQSLGHQGRNFIGSGPTADDIRRFTGRPAMEPIRVFAGIASAATLQDEADLVLAELKRTGGFDRSILAVATTTGSGWVDNEIADPLEYMYGGDTAIASMQYSYLPSWISFLVDKSRARTAGRDLFDTIYDYWATLPPGHRPRLVVFGESLGTFGSSAAFSGLADLTNRASGALFVGPPDATELWHELVDRRVPGTPERLPVYGDGQTVRFAASAADLRTEKGAPRSARVVFLQHASDPVVWWSPRLLWTAPDWLHEPRGPDVATQLRWFPVATFWQVTSDMAISLEPPPGHGHRYGPEVPTAWVTILHPPHWTEAESAALPAEIDRVAASR